MNDEVKKINLDQEVFDPNYATKQELNAEATLRADHDEKIIDEVNILRRTQNKKIEDIQTQLGEDEEKLSDLGEQIIVAEGNIKINQDKIAEIEGCFWDRIKELETEKEELNSQLEDSKKTIDEKNDEIEKLREELKKNGRPSDIYLGFAEIPEFEINEIISVKQFINDNLKNLIIPKMEIRYPDAQLDIDYTIILNGLNYIDIMQGKNITVLVKAIESGKLTGASSFGINVSYSYDLARQEKFVEEFLQSAIPVSLRNVPESASPNYDVPKEIIETKPLQLLIHNQDSKLPFKIFGEMNSGSYWTDFHRNWQSIQSGYNGTGQSTIGTNKIINSINDLFDNNSGYYQKVFDLIEQQLNDSGVSCTITKKWARTSKNSKTLHTLGNLTFNVANANLDNDEIVITQARFYYLMINFELNVNNGFTKFYRGVTLVLSDNLELY